MTLVSFVSVSLVEYEVSISYGSQVIAKVKVFVPQIDRYMYIDKTKSRCSRIPFQGKKIQWLYIAVPHAINIGQNDIFLSVLNVYIYAIYMYCKLSFICGRFIFVIFTKM